MEASQHRSLVEMDNYHYGLQDRNSDMRVDSSEANSTQPRFSDYEYSLNWETERKSTGVVYDPADIRVSASSDRLLRRGRANVHSNNRISSIYGGSLTSWATDRLQNDLLHFVIPEDSESGLTTSSAQSEPVILANSAVKGNLLRPEERASLEMELKLSRISVEDRCYTVLPVALKKYNIPIDFWSQYAIFIDYMEDGQKRMRQLHPTERPLAALEEMRRDEIDPQLMLGLLTYSSSLPQEWSVATISNRALWHAVAISYTEARHSDTPPYNYLRHGHGNVFDVLGDRGLPLGAWLARPSNNVSGRVGLIMSSNVLRVPLLSEISGRARLRILALVKDAPFKLDVVRAYVNQSRSHGPGWSRVSILLIMGRIGVADDRKSVGFRALAYYAMDRYPRFQLMIYPDRERQQILPGLKCFADGVLTWLEIVQGKDIKDEWSELGDWLQNML